MRRIMIVALSAALLSTAAWVVHGAAGSTSTVGSSPSAAANPSPPTDTAPWSMASGSPSWLRWQTNWPGPASPPASTPPTCAPLRAAKTDGYQIITRMIPDMGWHFLNPTIQGFDITKPPILVYERHGRRWQLAALEWVFPQQPEVPLLPGATYGSFAAACHYRDGTFVFARVQELCAKRSPQTGARFNFWHPDLVTLHVWLWYHNPDGLYSGTNPLVSPFNHS